VLWSGADSRDALLSGLSSIASLLDLPQKDEKDLAVVAAAAKSWLESHGGWLLVLDNVEDWSVVREFVPSAGSGHVVITTRLRFTGGIASCVDLEEMDPEEGADFLLRRAKITKPATTDREVALEITKAVNGLPLTLDQAGAYYFFGVRAELG